MKLIAKTTKSFAKAMQKEHTLFTKSIQGGVANATQGLKSDLRKQITGAGMGTKLANSWRSKLYGQQSNTPAGFVYTNAPLILQAFDKGVLIKAKNSQYLSIPTSAAPKRGKDGKKINPANFPEDRLGELHLVKTRSGVSFLVVHNVRGSFSKKTGQLRGYKKASDKSISSGRNLSSAIMFMLVPQAKIPKRLNVASAAQYWLSRMPDLINRHYQQQDRI